jgi:hypothetical protein
MIWNEENKSQKLEVLVEHAPQGTFDFHDLLAIYILVIT